MFLIQYNNSNDELLATNDTIQEEQIITVKESVFMEMMNDIYINYKEYENKIVSYEGFMHYFDDMTIVARKYYCCGYDAYLIGLECVSEGELPEDNEWVKVEGVIGLKEEIDGIYPYLDITNIQVLETRGQETIMY